MKVYIGITLLCLSLAFSCRPLSVDSGGEDKSLQSKPLAVATRATVQEKSPVSILAMGNGAGFIAVDAGLEKEAVADPKVEPLSLADDGIDSDLITDIATLGSMVVLGGAALAVKKIRSSKSLAAKKSRFAKKMAKNLNKMARKREYAFTEIPLTPPEKDRLKLGKGLEIKETELKAKDDKAHGKLFLGILPDEAILKDAFDGNAGAILSLNEALEFTTPVKDAKKKNFIPFAREHNKLLTETQKEAMKSKGLDEIKPEPKKIDVGALADIEWKHIQTPDYKGVNLMLVDEGADWVAKQIKAGKNVYVHCKSGKGRSATVVAAYLMKYHGYTFKEVQAYIRGKRKWVSIHKWWQEHYWVLKNYEKFLKKNPREREAILAKQKSKLTPP